MRPYIMKSGLMRYAKYLMPVLIIIVALLLVSYGLLNSRSETICAERRDLVDFAHK